MSILMVNYPVNEYLRNNVIGSRYSWLQDSREIRTQRRAAWSRYLATNLYARQALIIFRFLINLPNAAIHVSRDDAP